MDHESNTMVHESIDGDGSSNFFLFDQLQLWDVWLERILVTIVIVVLWDTFMQPKHQRQQLSDHTTINTRASYLDHDDEGDDGDRSELLPQPVEDLATETRVGCDDPKSCISNSQNNDDESIDRTADLPPLKDRPNDSECRQSSRNKTNQSSASPSTPIQPSPVLHRRIRADSNKHPGMSGFAHYYEAETNLYRIYTLTRRDGVEVVPPYIPHSYRGNVSIELHVTNETNHDIHVFWVDYKGKHIPKGKIQRNHVWTQTTWIDHRE